MSCVLPEDIPNRVHASGDRTSPLLTDLANGLHAMAQPLTILRGALGALTLTNATSADQERYLDMSTKQLERTCALLSNLQRLLDVALFEAARTNVDLWEVVAPVLEDLETALQDKGIRIEATKPDHDLVGMIDAGRTEQGLRAALEAAASASSRDDVIFLSILPRTGSIDLVVRTRSTGRHLNSSDRLNLSLVEASIRSQQGVVECSEDPFRITIKIPAPASIAPSDEADFARSSIQPPGSRLPQLNT
jgi:K+-sensing histidine kinase KdpD